MVPVLVELVLAFAVFAAVALMTTSSSCGLRPSWRATSSRRVDPFQEQCSRVRSVNIKKRRLSRAVLSVRSIDLNCCPVPEVARGGDESRDGRAAREQERHGQGARP